ncbi:MAG: GcrA cell cycle regulator [Acetobacteraceae bacterium]|nr:GcrA cell cycle regulator [Acetobacteraceae bacterium]
MRLASDAFDWNDDKLLRLRRLWAEGLSTAEIGRGMGVSKNAVVGKVHRLHLPARASPIRTCVDRKPDRPRRAPRLTLRGLQPPIPSTTSQVVRPHPAPPIWRAREPMKLGAARCCWPIGHPGTPEFRFCGDANAVGYPYCPDHCALAYRPALGRADAA